MINKQDRIMSSFMKNGFILFLFSQVFFNHTFISQFTMIIMTLIVVLLCLIKKKFYFGSYFVFTIFFILQSYTISTNGISIDPQTSMKMTITLVLNLIISLVVYNYILIYDNLENTLYYFAKIIMLFSFLLIMFSFGSVLNSRLGTDISLNILGSNVVYNANDIALLAGFCCLIFFYKYHKSKDKLNILYMLWIILIILLTGSRKGLLLLALGIPLLEYMLNPKKLIKNILISILIIIVLYFVVMKIPLFYNIIGNRFEALIKIMFGYKVDEASANTRILFTQRGWEYFLQKPWTGYGLDCFRNLAGSYGLYSHNNYIELLVSGGIPAFIFYYLIRIIVLIKLFVNRNLYNINKLLFVILLVLTVLEYGFVSYFERLYIILFIFVLSGHKKIKGKKIYENKE